MQVESDLLDLVDNPRETLTVELKPFHSLDDQYMRSHLARHLCALANHGGGYLVFGFEDDYKPCPEPSDIETAYHRDEIANLVATYLTPAFQCESTVVRSTAGHRSVVVRVPPHGTVPVCAIRDGTPDKARDKGGRIGIRKGVHYTRTNTSNGTASVPVDTAELWRPIIRRCVVADRETLLSLLGPILSQSSSPEPRRASLAEWHNRVRTRFAELLSESQFDWPVPLAKNHYQLSYQIEHGSDDKLSISTLVDTLLQVSAEVHDLVKTGWSMFYPFKREGIAPTVFEDLDGDVIETNLLRERFLQSTLPDVWRVSQNGFASIVRAYREDRPDGRDSDPGKRLQGWMIARELTELVRHARALATRLPTASAVSFRCEWWGLSGRMLYDRQEGHYPQRIAKADHRTSIGRWPIASLAQEWPTIVADLLNPVVALFDPNLTLSPEWIRQQNYRLV